MIPPFEFESWVGFRAYMRGRARNKLISMWLHIRTFARFLNRSH